MANLKTPSTSFVESALLDKIDKLFECGVGDHVALPQLVVVGDQSSGKSSVLEGLTKLPFPRDSTLCTRFATQVTFRRSPDRSHTVTIIPSKGTSAERLDAIEAYKKEYQETLNADAFRETMAEVLKVMRLGPANVAGVSGASGFSEHVLKIEVCGPEEEHFSVIDVPGIFEKTTEGVTTKADKELVRSMVERYMDNPRSVMLAVVPSNVDIATQKILTMAEEADSEGSRTLGVLTKPDLVDRGAEQHVLDLLNNKSHKLKLGWCLVRNPGQQQLQDFSVDRAAIEENFFMTKSPWKTLNKERVGIEALRFRLQDILAGHIRREFPKVRSEITKKLKIAEDRLHELGSKRETSEDQRRYLLELSMKFHEVTGLALSASYHRSDWFHDNNSLRIATLVVTRSEKLAEDLQKFGHLYEFDSAEARVSGDCVKTRMQPQNPDLNECTTEEELIEQDTEIAIFDWLREVYNESRGFEVGTFSAKLLPETMKTQSWHWESFAVGYISDIITMVHEFVVALLEKLCRYNVRAREALIAVLMDELMAKYKAATDQVHLLLYQETVGTPSTYNHYFAENLEKSRQQRMTQGLDIRSVRLDQPAQSGIQQTPQLVTKMVALDDLVRARSISNVDQTVNEMHDILKSYYKVARKRFVDNLSMQSAGYYLVTGPEAALKLFNPSWVIKLSVEKLEDIAGEEPGLKRQRKALEKEIKALKAGKRILM